MDAMNNAFFIAGAAMLVIGTLCTLHAYFLKAAVLHGASAALTFAYREGLNRGRMEGVQSTKLKRQAPTSVPEPWKKEDGRE